MENGRSYTIPLSSLSSDDQAFAKSWEEQRKAIADAPRPKTEPIMSTPGKVLYQASLREMPDSPMTSVGKMKSSALKPVASTRISSERLYN